MIQIAYTRPNWTFTFAANIALWDTGNLSFLLQNKEMNHPLSLFIEKYVWPTKLTLRPLEERLLRNFASPQFLVTHLFCKITEMRSNSKLNAKKANQNTTTLKKKTHEKILNQNVASNHNIRHNTALVIPQTKVNNNNNIYYCCPDTQ